MAGGTGHRPVLSGDPPDSRTHGAFPNGEQSSYARLGGTLPPRTGRWPVQPGPNRIIPAKLRAWRARLERLTPRQTTHGLQLLEGATMQVEGTPLYPCRFVRYNLVQEQAGTNWSAASAGWGIVHSSDAAPSAQASFRFTEWSAPPAAADHVQCGGTSGGTSWFRFRDCSFFNGGVYILAPRVALTNCLLHRSPVLVYGDASETRNCLFVGGSFYVDGTWGTHQVFDTFFDRTFFDTNSWTGTINHYNGYITNENHLAPEGTNNVVVTDMAYQAGPLGLFYQPTNSFLLNTGSVSAASAGLWHFTVTTNQLAETNSVVDIGMHFVALNSQLSTLNPLDTDSDGLANIFEDLDGDGVVDSSETDWNNPADVGLRIVITQPKSGSNIP